MPIEALIQAYGYPALAVGTFLEGETILVLAGFMAHRGYLDLGWVIAAGFVGSMSGDLLYFFLGRRHGQSFLAKRPSWGPRIDRVNGVVRKYGTPVILGFRFFYGFRTITPFVLGMSGVPAWKYALLNATSALAWAAAVGGGAYLFGNALELVFGDIKRYELGVAALIAAGGGAVWAVHLIRNRRKRTAA